MTSSAEQAQITARRHRVLDHLCELGELTLVFWWQEASYPRSNAGGERTHIGAGVVGPAGSALGPQEAQRHGREASAFGVWRVFSTEEATHSRQGP
jgi:hypothetical protein